MDTKIKEQYRTGFEAWARGEGMSTTMALGREYLSDKTRAARAVWTASKRDTSTEPSVKLEAAWRWIANAPHVENCFLHDDGEFKRCFCDKDALLDYIESDEPSGNPGELAAGALTDDAKEQTK